MFDFDKNILDEEVKSFIDNSNLIEERFRDLADLSNLLSNLVIFAEQEKLFKKYVKKGYKTYVCVIGPLSTSGYCTTLTKAETVGSESYKEFLEKYTKDIPSWFTPKAFSFESVDDFNLTY